jgi:hypothetical protein
MDHAAAHAKRVSGDALDAVVRAVVQSGRMRIAVRRCSGCSALARLGSLPRTGM